MSERAIVPVERTRAGKRLLEELSESPLPGARYAVDVVGRRLQAVEEEAAAAERGRMPVDDVDLRSPVTIPIEPAVTLLAGRWYRPLVTSRADGSVQVQFEDVGE